MVAKEKVLFLLHLPPPVHGSSLVGQYIKGSDLINNKFSTRYINLLASKRVDDSGKVSLSKLLGMIVTIINLLRELILHRPQLCYLALTSTGAAFYRDVLLISLLKLFGVKRIYHMHNKGIRRNEDYPFHSFFYRFVFNGSNVILLAKKLYKDVQTFVPEKNVDILPNGIPQKPFKVEEIKDKEIINILFLSNLIESKGVYVLLRAMAILKRKGIVFKGTFIGGEGDISSDQLTQKVNQFELQNQVEYLGKRYGADKELAFCIADIFAFPTFYANECFPLVLLEAMQHSLPVISTNEGGIPDIIEESITGFIVTKNDSLALANKLEVLITNPELRKSMGKKGYEKFHTHYTIDQFENRLCEILEIVLQKD
ncbi:glycosyltransferase family 4 protein [Carboxylicivirga linearis]|uniref:Glycosyltransferase family 4 protein n=1 Tax=Carboxylicivirga linearis TaxID=1628157 RepID=A0ABS5JQG6_9BACT|nr:glycosyltransferase family 4 protein [Carboxylicivirga linearis]MBS2097109.1 glycosyltransferase family 4 protein [Carboxylicivirga linearis]